MSEQSELKYNGFIPPCGVYCGNCPNFTRTKNRCEGADKVCKTRKCKSFYVCCIEKNGLAFCYQCNSYPCSRYRKFTETWLQYGQNLIENQSYLKENGKDDFVRKMN